ncbi:MAG: hypothetical protein ABMA14_00655 [Hyphomonadaceae bacterium]
MLNRWIARACIGLVLLGSGVSASLSWAQTQTQKSVQSYVNITLPAIARMKPWIDKSAADRAGAFATMGFTDTTCDASVTEATTAHEHFAEGAGELCGAMVAWMQNEDIYTCSRVKFSGIDFAHTEPVDPTIARLHKSEGVLATRLKLEKAAGCATKTVAYWGPRLLSLVDQLSASVTNAGDLQAPSSGAAALTTKAFEYTVFQCHLAYNADEKTKSAVVDAADDACYAMNYLLDHKVLDACRTLDKSITKAVSMGASDPLAAEARVLSGKLATRFGSLDCGTVIATAKVAEDEAKAKQAAAAAAAAQASAPSQPAPNPYEKRNAIVGEINGETQSFNNSLEVAQRWFDRGEDYEACGYYQQALTSLRRLETLYSDLNRETGDSDYRAKSREMKDQQDIVFENHSDMCMEAERRLY